jgi:NAD(P)H-dependent FMN reductase
MTNKPNILAICGSTKSSSTNRNLILAIADLFEDVFRVELFEDISLLPHFNPDIDNDSPPFPVLQFRQKLRGADAVLICTPEYAMGVPGTLKNAKFLQVIFRANQLL